MVKLHHVHIMLPCWKCKSYMKLTTHLAKNVAVLKPQHWHSKCLTGVLWNDVHETATHSPPLLVIGLLPKTHCKQVTSTKLLFTSTPSFKNCCPRSWARPHRSPSHHSFPLCTDLSDNGWPNSPINEWDNNYCPPLHCCGCHEGWIEIRKYKARQKD